MSAEDPRPDSEPAPSPAPLPPPQPRAPAGAAPFGGEASVRRIVIAAAAIIVLALGGYYLVRSGVFGGAGEAGYTVEAYQPPQQLISARERVLAHAQPDAASPTVVMFGQGVALDVNGRVSRGLGNDWYRIAWNGQTAFIRQQDTVAGEEAPPTVAERPKPDPDEAKPRVIEEPDVAIADFPEAPPPQVGLADVIWVREPSARDFARFYPSRALDQGRSGRVVLDCVANARGALDCSVVEESPTGWGFGDAALRIARQSRIAPRAEDGSSVAGRHVRLPLSFRAG